MSFRAFTDKFDYNLRFLILIVPYAYRDTTRRVEYAPRNTSRTELATISIRYSYTPYFNP